MSYTAPDLYYQPEKFGLTPIAEIDYSSGSYEFDLRVVWKHESGKLYTARDRGCSCPSPFEGFLKLEDAEELSYAKLQEEIETELKDDYKEIQPHDGQEFLCKVKEAIEQAAKESRNE